ncbi:HAD family hydrolase [Clostridium psychrophilum]|uniref:HAD family hydrolase n=1 Tax=Clostridium psychrophilum TaxID=132926 RepID=UPI001C0C5049|nr:HAD family phosphatase [Clostridium psychrophilum]MBU3179816.1 HAD family phosphatase [Clostridium psychrophilum]
MVKALIFDMDGVIADTEPAYFKASNKLLEKYGLCMSKEFFKTIMGKNHIEAIRMIKSTYNIEDDENILLKIRNAYFIEIIKRKLTNIEGLHEILDYIKESGLMCAVATGTSKEIAEVILDKLGILNSFDYIIYGDDMKFSKPNSWVYEHVVKRLNLKSSECIILEDSPNGIKAGIGSHCMVISVNSPTNIENVIGLLGKARNLYEALKIVKKIT